MQGKNFIIETEPGHTLGKMEGAGVDCPRIGEKIDLSGVRFKVVDVIHTMTRTQFSVEYYIRIIVE